MEQTDITSYGFSSEITNDLFIPSPHVNAFECTLNFDWTLKEMISTYLLNTKCVLSYFT